MLLLSVMAKNFRGTVLLAGSSSLLLMMIVLYMLKNGNIIELLDDVTDADSLLILIKVNNEVVYMSIGLTILFVSLMVVFNVLYFVSAKDSAFGGSHYYLVCSLL